MNIYYYLNGKKHGEHKWYSVSGKLLGIRSYDNDKVVGESKEYYENGVLHITIYYNDEGDIIREIQHNPADETDDDDQMAF